MYISELAIYNFTRNFTWIVITIMAFGINIFLGLIWFIFLDAKVMYWLFPKKTEHDFIKTLKIGTDTFRLVPKENGEGMMYVKVDK